MQTCQLSEPRQPACACCWVVSGISDARAPRAQDDLLYENLTVYETLYYAAMLRLPRDMPEAEKVARVNAVIAALGIDSCRDTIIGELLF